MQKKMIAVVIGVIIIAIAVFAVLNKSSSSGTSNANNMTANASIKPSGIIQTKTAANVGKYLADSSGNALYIYGGDTKGVSNCSGACLASWPVYSPTSSSASLPANISIITRADGSKQYAYKGMPLYTFTGDSPGQVTGDGVSNFHIAKP
ncbi:MAG TPA: hypothetical protein VFN31_00860 [Candidatus Saccharimonadales bacterium]|nr:hypothetical protein [Candidatus Saccharimonadales bacterium]